MRSKKEFVFLLGLLMLSFASASFSIGNASHSIQTVYLPSQNIKGWVNLSLNEESSDSLFEDSFGNSVKLINMLKANSNLDYHCEPLDCAPIYSSGSGFATKSFNMIAGEKKDVGFKLNGTVLSVNFINFTIESTASESCDNQLKLDFVKDNIIDVGNDKISSSSCNSKDYGCFETGVALYEGEIVGEIYCQEITLSEAPGFKLGAWVKEAVPSATELRMSLYDKNGNSMNKYCKLPTASSTGRQISCDIDFSVANTEKYLVCISSQGTGGSYKLHGYSKTNGCGYKGSPGSVSKNFAYEIFAEKKKFGSFGLINVSSSISKWSSLPTTIKNYIQERYNNDCSLNCIVPIEIISQQNQGVTIKNLTVKYSIGGGLEPSTSDLYDLTETPAKITSEYMKITLDNGNLTVPLNYGNKSYELKLNSDEILSERVLIEEAPSINSLSPRITALGVPTTFKISSNSLNINKYYWDFGDSKNTTTTNNKVIHTYTARGYYNLAVTLSGENGLSYSMTFNITVDSPQQAINSTLEKKSKDLEKVLLQVSQTNFENELKSVLNLNEAKKNLIKVEQDYKKASSDANYVEVMTNLLNVEVPESVEETKIFNSATFYQNKQNINPEIVESIGGGTYKSQDKESYVDAIFLWNQENIETKVDFREFSASYGYLDESPVLRGFDLQINKKDNSNAYLIFEKMDGLQFDKDYSEREKTGYIYIELKDGVQTIKFSTIEDVDFTNVPIFISPKLESLKIAKSIDTNGNKNGFSKWFFFGLIIFLLLIAGFVIYIFMQEWYKRKYENYLFQNRNDLYNIMIYINDSKKRQMEDKEIGSKLKNAGWNSEQVAYAIKKFSGKRTGMVEIISFDKKKTETPPRGNIPKNSPVKV